MLVKDENKFSYIVNDEVSKPKDSLEEAIQEYIDEAKKNNYSLDSVEINNPHFLFLNYLEVVLLRICYILFLI